jgi:cytochrome c-type biogenesis protein CcmH
MLLWTILTAMTAVAAVVLAIPLIRRHEARVDARTATIAVLKDQLADVDVQLAAGTIPPADAEGLRIEIKRRMLAAGHIGDDAGRSLGSRALAGVAIGMAALVALAAGALYTSMGKPGMGGSAVPAATPPGNAPPAADAAPQAAEIASLLGALEKRVAGDARNPEGWRMLGWAYYQTERFADAANAYAKAVALKPDGPGYQSAYGEALVLAADGQVTPAARAAFDTAVAQDGNDARARYFIGIARQQGGDAAGAIADWLKLLADSTGDAPWVPQVRSMIETVGREAKIDVAARLAAIRPLASGGASVAPPPLPGLAGVAASAAGPAAPGPTPDQVAGAANMAPADRQAMIASMVDGLAKRLAANPDDEAGWLRLMRSRSVLGDAAAAGKARDDALRAFAGDAAATARIKAAATELGL